MAKAAASRPDLLHGLFGQQRAFVESPAVFCDATCSRRAGKTHGAATKLIRGYERRNGVAPSLYFTLTRIQAKRNIWPTLLDLNRRYSLGFEANESELILKRNGRGAIYLAGIDNRSEIDKLRGTGWGEVVGDEAQAFPAYFRELVQDVLIPSFMDHDGHLSLIGTPGPVPVGYFHDITHSPEWAHFNWSSFDNPHVDAQGLLETTLKMRGVSNDDPSISREFYGKWAHDPNALVFRYSAELNHFRDLPLCRKEWQHVIGVDLGYDDADAISVVAFNEESPAAYLVEEWTQAGLTVSALTAELQQRVDKYHPLSIVVDTGGLGKKVAKEVTLRSGVPLKAAEKDRKFEYIELLNDAMRSGRFFAKSGGRFAQDCMLVEWDRSKPETMKVSDRYHSDSADATLYAFRESLHWLHEPAKPPPTLDQWHREQEAAMMAEMEREIEERKREEQEVWG